MRWRTRGLIRSYWDIWIVAAAVVVANLRLPAGGSTDNLALVPAKVAAGEWWRLLTHPFAHITVYHLLLDGVPFFLLYPFLDEKRPGWRLMYVVFSGAGAAAAAWGLPVVSEGGFRGLSGVTYGVMAVASLEMACGSGRTGSQRAVGAAVLAFLTAMIAAELATGRFPFEFLLFGMVGTPVLACHAGGVIGALCAHLLRGARTGFRCAC